MEKVLGKLSMEGHEPDCQLKYFRKKENVAIYIYRYNFLIFKNFANL